MSHKACNHGTVSFVRMRMFWGEKHNFGSCVGGTTWNQLSRNRRHGTWKDDGTLRPLGKHRMRDDHHSDEDDEDTVDPTAQTESACFPGDSRLSPVDLHTFSLTRTCPKWGHIHLHTWAATTVFPEIARAWKVCSYKINTYEINMHIEVQESNGKSYDVL